MRNSPGIEHRQTAAWPSRLALEQEPLLVQRVASPEMMMALVAAGPALGFAGAAYIVVNREANIVGRPLAGTPSIYLLLRDAGP